MRLLKSVIAGVSVLLITGGVQAATLNSVSIAMQDGDGENYSLTSSIPSNSFELSWGTPAPDSVFVEFDVTGPFNLILDNFPGTSGGMRLQLRDASGDIQAFSPAPAGFTTSTTSEVGALNNLADVVDVNFTSNGGGLRAEVDASGAIFTQLVGGTYFLGVQNTGNPTSTLASFSITAVPVPAAGLLFGSALMGAAALRRRKAAQVAA